MSSRRGEFNGLAVRLLPLAIAPPQLAAPAAPSEKPSAKILEIFNKKITEKCPKEKKDVALISLESQYYKVHIYFKNIFP